ncbi:undecaprenyldiphospho-muramoylpentapeptide beta-N-acetylglucosaminyltransferase [Amaricoccus macauensis]|uniref:undecaprenyldiphospho-muramoylpentapeptide beta-N-acetylglucosaminyltransferase n=1 Tax=Amaricoccus macauensis TaxID=57001 RepID=UPI003C7A060B
MSRPPLLVIAAGGTGGHMFPAQALAEEMLARGWRVRLSTDPRGARYAGGFPEAVERGVTSSGTFAQGSPISRATTPFTVAAGIAKTVMAMRRDRPACVAGFGGYPALPATAAATFLRIPRLIHEQNGVLGRVNRIFAPRVDRVACGVWPTALPKESKGEFVGNPVRASVLAQAGATYLCPETGPIEILVMGGSQGAGSFARLVPPALEQIPDALRQRLRLSQQVRPEDMDRVRAVYDGLGLDADLRGFFDDVPERLARASLVISRAGAGSISDITVVGRPAILIPYPSAADDHQAANAAGLVEAGGAFMIREEELTPEGLAGHITAILSDPEGASAMAAASHAHGRPEATQHLAGLVEELAQQGRAE